MKEWPLIKDLPADEQEPFTKWLYGQTCPWMESGEKAYYPWDYNRWKAGKQIAD